MILASPGDIAFKILNFPVYYYGIILAFAILIGVFTAYKLFGKFYDKSRAEIIVDISPYLILYGIIGARLYYCLVNFRYYFLHPLDILNLREGGLSVHGMIIAGFLTIIFLSKKYKIESSKLFDVFFCGSALAQSIGRWGNFFNSEAFGIPYDGFLKLYIPIESRPIEFINVKYFHPAFLYESILDFLIFVILFLLFKKYSKTPGVISGLYLILYGAVRILTEQIRIDSALNILGIPVAQIFSALMIICGIIWLCNIKNLSKIKN